MKKSLEKNDVNFQVEQTLQTQQSEQSNCKFALSFCGLQDKKYPDKRAMGFPFDRPFEDEVETFSNFIGHNTNMAVTRITVIHSQEVRRGNLVAKTVISAKDIINDSGPSEVGQPRSQSGVPNSNARVVIG